MFNCIQFQEIVMYLYDLPTQKKNVPDLIKDPVALIKDVRSLVERHCKDIPELAITGKPILHPDLNKLPPPPKPIAFHDCDVNFDYANDIQSSDNQIYCYESTNNSSLTTKSLDVIVSSDQSPPLNESMQFVSPQNISTNRTGPRGPLKKQCQTAISPTLNIEQPSSERHISNSCLLSSSLSPPNSSAPRRRRTRCKICEACQRSDCGGCSFCLDMVKFGGPGRAKQTCMMRQCLQPMLPVTAQCIYCHLDGWRQTPVLPQTKMQQSVEGPSALMECSVCYEISHPECAQQSAIAQNTIGVVNEDLPNSWECPTCCILGKNNDYKVRAYISI